MSSISIPKRSTTRFVAVVATSLVVFGRLSPATASEQNNPDVLTSHKPWLAPTVIDNLREPMSLRAKFRRRGSESNRFSMENSIAD